MMTSSASSIRAFTLAIPQTELDDLQHRLSRTRWPDAQLVTDWSQGVPLAFARQIVDHWRGAYDWRRCEAMLNGFGQFTTQIDGVDIHFLHIRSPEPGARPLLITHGWPGSVIEFHKIIGPLTDPVAHGGKAEDAFHLVLPSLPGFGFSGKPTGTGWGVTKIAKCWIELMSRLGYDRYLAQGGDWGAAVTTALGVKRPDGLQAIHVNMPLVVPQGPYENLSEAEAATLGQLAQYDQWEGSYADQQATRPQTLGYGLADSPVGQAMWIIEKYRAWTDCDGDPLNVFSMDELLDNVMLYWLSNSATSSARLYWESFRGGFGATPLDIPTGCSIYPHEIYRAPKSWVEKSIHNLIHWSELDKGGHFAAFEQPDLFVNEIRTCFKDF